uniref:Uncharacterized protein n=1 Tax=viral metagenome TaxID=1070528 RepID=A0A6C0LSQ5_9ZZZZ
MVVYDVKKNILVSEQNELFIKNDLVGVVNKFNEIDTNIVENCPVNRIASERLKFRAKTDEWNMFSPKFRFNKHLGTIDTSALSMAIEKQCAKIGNYFYHFEMSDDKQQCLREQIPLLWNNDITKASDGVYTWFIFTDTKNKSQFVAKKALTIQEISTKHSNIISDILDDLQTIHYAGEFKKTCNSIEINFLSGTYMAAAFETLSSVTDVINTKNEAVTFLNKKFKGQLVFTDQNKADTFITVKNITYTRENIELLLDCGATIKRFETGMLCRKYNNRHIDRIRAETIHDMNVRVWERLGGTKPVFNYIPPSIIHVDITLENLDSVDFPTTDCLI